MTVYVVTGKLGEDMTLVAVGRIRDYLFQERKIATSLADRREELTSFDALKTFQEQPATCTKLSFNPEKSISP